MTPLTYALVADGPTDRALLPIIAWSLRTLRPQGLFASPLFFPRGSRPIAEMVKDVRAAYRPRMILVHRDAEKISYNDRRREIPCVDGLVAIVPVRMTEAWLLIDEGALRKAASNPNGTMALDLPEVHRLERLTKPKDKLRELLVEASGLHGRRRQLFDRAEAAGRLAELIDDFSPLRDVPAFNAFWNELTAALDTIAPRG
jgi:hypothetical protein